MRELPLTKVIATHDLEMVRVLCQRAILLDGGRVVADDLARRLLSDHPLLASHGLAPPNIKHHRLPAPDLSFTRPNLPFLVEEIERQVLQQSEV